MIRALTTDDFEAVHAGFVDAFSDYVIPLSPTREQLCEMLTRRGWRPEVSVGAFEGERLVGFTLNALDGDRAYDSGTGVAPTHRRRGLARELTERSFGLLRDAGAREYVLEVIDSNTRAVELYRATGFVETRGLQCWRYESSSLQAFESSSVQPAWCDVAPSWQNSAASIARADDPHVVLGDANGYAIVFPGSGDLAQLAVRREARRRGVGARLLNAAASAAEKPLRIINVDDRDAGIAAFLEHAGAMRTVRQLEMTRPL